MSFCVNDNKDVEWNNATSSAPGSASHWSLLFVDIEDKLAFQLDTLDDFNLKHALQFSESLSIGRESFHSVGCERQKKNFEWRTRRTTPRLEELLTVFSLLEGSEPPTPTDPRQDP